MTSAGISNNRINQASNQQEFMSTAGEQSSREEALAVTRIIKSMRVQRENKISQSKSKKGSKILKMVGKTKFDLPTAQTLEETYYKN